MVDEKAETLIRQLKSALDEYNSYNGESLTSVILYMRDAQRYLRTHKNSENSHKKLEGLIPACKKKIVENNLGLVIKIARFYCNITGESYYYDDFLSEGIIGVLKAIPKYNPMRGKFSNYASASIRQNIRKKIREILGSVRLPVDLPFYQKNLEYFLKLFKEKYNKVPTDKELAKFSGKSVKRIGELRRMKSLYRTFSLDAKLFHEEGGRCLLDYIDSYRDYSMEEEVIDRMTYQELIDCIKELQNKKQMRVLLGRLEGKTFKEIGKEENLTKQRIEQIEKKAITKVEKMERYQRLLPEQKRGLKFDYPNMVRELKRELKNNIPWIRWFGKNNDRFIKIKDQRRICYL